MKESKRKTIKNLFLKKENGWGKTNKKAEQEINKFAESYIRFLNAARTERESVKEIERIVKKNGFLNLDKTSSLKPGDRVYQIKKEKSIFLASIGKTPKITGVVSHIDSPRIDLKPMPLIEDSELALLKTQYYGGIKKYQWTNRALSIHGVIFTKDLKKIEIRIGDNDNEPSFIISDLLPHLATDQMQKSAKDAVTGESLNIIIGNRITNDKDDKIKDKVKANILSILNKKYSITEEDFISAEIEIVPSEKARFAGLDRSMIIGYGQDDRSCSYASLRGILDTKNQKNTAISFFVDKEEIGSEGNTTAKTRTITNFIKEITKKAFPKSLKDINKIIEESEIISADVTAGVNPDYKDVHDLKNAAYISRGIVIEKYTGNHGKYMSNDANAEYVGKIRNLMNKNNIIWQSASLGKVDTGGGGTVAIYFSQLGFEVIDMGIPLLGMHSPMELSSTLDLYQAYNAYRVFLNGN